LRPVDRILKPLRVIEELPGPHKDLPGGVDANSRVGRRFGRQLDPGSSRDEEAAHFFQEGVVSGGEFGKGGSVPGVPAQVFDETQEGALELLG
jgi:hypothetical protein